MRAVKGGTALPITLVRTVGFLLEGRVRFPRHRIGEILREGDEFVVFRHVEVEPPQARPGAILKIRFRFKNLPPWANRRLSAIPTPFIVGVPGFRSKKWAMCPGTGEFLGYYEFDGEEEAGAYMHSFAVWLLEKRARTGSFQYEITRA